MKQRVAILILLLLIVFHHASHGFVFIPKSEHSDHEGDEDLRLELPQPWIIKCIDPVFEILGSYRNLTVQTKLPPSENVLNIISLSLKNQSLTEIPKYISKLDFLECLDVGGNKILSTKLLSFDNNEHLTSLFLDNQSPQTMIEGIFPPRKVFYPKLWNLDVSGNRIRYLANNFRYAFPDLRYLNLSNNNLSSTIFKNPPRRLHTLILRNTDIRIIKLNNHTNPYSLFLDNNHYPQLNLRIPKNSSLTVVGIKNAVHLSLSNCSIQMIHNLCFQRAVRLKTLDLSSNNLSSLTAKAIGIPSLVNLSLSHNHLKDFPNVKDIKRLNSLFLSYNDFTSVPLSINNHPVLETLTLRGNRLKYISDRTFAGLKYLRQLDLAENQFIKFGKTWTLNLNHLEYLNLNSNGMEQAENINLRDMKSLEQLFIRNNSYGRPYDKISNTLPFDLHIYIDEIHLTEEEQNNVITYDINSFLEDPYMRFLYNLSYNSDY